MITLDTIQRDDIIALFYSDNGEAAGYLGTITSTQDGKMYWRHFDNDGQFTGPRRRVLMAAKYDALAWAEEQRYSMWLEAETI